MSNITTPKPQAKRIPLKLKLQILSEILSPNSSISKIAKKHDLSTATLYSWRSIHNKTQNQNLKNNQRSQVVAQNNFIELLPTPSSSPTPPACNINNISTNPKLSAISLTLSNNISLSLKGNIAATSLMKLISCLEKEEPLC